MMVKTSEYKTFSNTPAESKFDVRLLEKKIEHGFLTRQDRDQYLKNLPEESEYEFTSAATLDAEVPPKV
jgi:hypothetical protein